MGSRERRQRHRDELRRRVLEVAEELFATDGYANVSMRRIADRIEYSPTTIYRLFENKDAIMEQLIADGYSGVHRRYQEILARRRDDPLALLAEVIRGYVEFALANPRHYELWFATSRIEVVDGSLQMQHGRARYRVYAVWLELIAECSRRGVLADRDSLELFQLIWAAVHGLIALRLHHPGFPWTPLADQVEGLLSMIRRGLAPDDDASQQSGDEAATAGRVRRPR